MLGHNNQKNSAEPELVYHDEPREAEVRAANKNVTACWILIITEIFYCFMYGFFMRIDSVSITTSEDFVITALLFVLIIAGFGLVLSYPFKLVWSSIGFNLLIVAISVQTYFLVNAFWTKAAIYYYKSAFSIDTFTITLTPDETTTALNTSNLN